jgi:hypothetical protein
MIETVVGIGECAREHVAKRRQSRFLVVVRGLAQQHNYVPASGRQVPQA